MRINTIFKGVKIWRVNMKQTLNKVMSFLDKYELINLGKNNKVLIFLIVCIITGMILGSSSVGYINMEVLHKLDFLFLNDFKERLNQSGLDIFVSSFSSLFIYMLFIEMAALSFWGVVAIPLLIVFKGLGLGLAAGYLYLIYGLKGIAFYILILLPGIFISSVGIVLFSVGAFKFSGKFAKKILPASHNNERLWNVFKVHIRKSGYSLILLAFSSVVDMSFMAMFSKFFEF